MENNRPVYLSNTFLGLPTEENLDAPVVVLPIPYDGTVSYRPGARDGATAIITASRYVELYDDELKRDISQIGIRTINELEPVMGGPDQMTRVIRQAATDFLARDKFLVSLGGEHSVSVGLVQAYSEKYSNLSVLQLDAHADLRDSYEGTSYSHASAMRRIRECAPAVQAGIRSFSEEDIEYIEEKGLDIIRAEEIVNGDNGCLERIESGLTDEVYITVDLDVFDPSVMPSTGTPEPGGLGWYDVLKILRHVSKKKKIVGFDIVELAPMAGNVAPDFLAAKLTYKLIGYSLQNKKGLNK